MFQGFGLSFCRRASRIAAVGLIGLFAAIFASICPGTTALNAAELGRASDAVRLVMVEAPGCRFCAQWHAEIGPAYPDSPEGRFAPLVRVGRDAPELKALKRVTFTPTFIVMRGNSEAGRLAGYPGKDYFWDELREVLAPAGFANEPSAIP